MVTKSSTKWDVVIKCNYSLKMAMWVCPSLGQSKLYWQPLPRSTLNVVMVPSGWLQISLVIPWPFVEWSCQIKIYTNHEETSTSNGHIRFSIQREHSLSFIHTFQWTSVLLQISAISKCRSLSFGPQRQGTSGLSPYLSKSCLAVQPLNDAVDKNLLAVNQ